jgi:fatty-acyl-CoA synthase
LNKHAQSLNKELENCKTYADVLRFRAQFKNSIDVRFLHLESHSRDPRGPTLGEDDSQGYSYNDVLKVAERSAHFLQSKGIGVGDKVCLVLPTGPAFMAAFFGCQLLGAIPVPAVPPYSLNRLDEYLKKTASLMSASESKALVTSEQLLPVFKAAGGRAFSNLISDMELLSHPTEIEKHAEFGDDATAMIQFTSGSTGAQKGVVLSHKNLLANVLGIGRAAEFVAEDVCVTWLPLYHDMGLIGHFLSAIVWGMPLILIPPQRFIMRPSSWLKAMTKFKGSASAAPNFAYSLCIKKITEKTMKDLDLSAWRVAFCGAEPIDTKTVRKFIEKFASCGFPNGTFFPVYGMAENALAVTFPPPGRGPIYDTIERQSFEATGRAISVPPETEGCLEHISVGRALPEHEVRVANEEGQKMPEGQLGEIEIRGPSLMQGYYKNPSATAEVMREGNWLRTGDLGYFRNSELYITGRRKEMIIKGGKNYFPQDIEGAAGQVEGIRMGCCAAFGLFNSPRGTEDLILICETRLKGEARNGLIEAVRKKVRESCGTSPDEVLLVLPGSVPKTSSGKIQRGLASQRYLKGDLTPGRKPVFTLARVYMYQMLQKLGSFTRGTQNRKGA